MVYASSVWTSCNKLLLETVLRIQKRAARIFLNAPGAGRTVTLFINLSWLPFYNEAYINRCAFAFKRINGTLPHYLITSLRKNSITTPETQEIVIEIYCLPPQKHLRGGTHLRGENC